MPGTDVSSLLADLERAAAERLEARDAAAFAARAAHRLPDVVALLEQLYGERNDTWTLTRTLLSDLVRLSAARPESLRALDRTREASPDWFQHQRTVGYVCYADRFAGTLTGVREHLDHLAALGITYLHLMPVLAPREGDSDGGYAVIDYDAVDPRIGTMADLSALAADLHERDMALCVDLVLNHTAREHEWARAAAAGDPHYRAFYLVFPDRTGPDAYEQTVLDIFPELSPGTFTYVAEMGGWVWTTFREFQWDLDYTNPDVFRAMLSTMLTLANRGTDVLRLDAAPFLWKRLGTSCMNLPETHLLLQAFRALVSIAAPGVLLKAEAMVEPDILTRYLGDHDPYRPECELAYDNQLMVMLWSTLATGDSALARQALTRRPPAPPATSWVTYLRCHDDIGWAVADEDAAAVGLDGVAHRRFLSDFYAGDVTGSFARGAVFQKNALGASPISGTAASLCGVQAALETWDAAALDVALSRLEAAYSIVYSFGGIPLLYMGDELAMLNDRAWADDPSHRGDNRWMHRPPMDWAAARQHDPGTAPGRMFAALCSLAAARAALPALRGGGHTHVRDTGPGLFAYRRAFPGTTPVLALVDLTGRGQSVPTTEDFGVLAATGTRPATLGDGVLTLPAYGFAWLVAEPQ